MLALLSLVFFAGKLRSLLKAHLYHRAFSFFAVIAVTGMLLATLLSFNIQNSKLNPGLTASQTARK